MTSRPRAGSCDPSDAHEESQGDPTVRPFHIEVRSSPGPTSLFPRLARRQPRRPSGLGCQRQFCLINLRLEISVTVTVTATQPRQSPLPPAGASAAAQTGPPLSLSRAAAAEPPRSSSRSSPPLTPPPASPSHPGPPDRRRRAGGVCGGRSRWRLRAVGAHRDGHWRRHCRGSDRDCHCDSCH